MTTKTQYLIEKTFEEDPVLRISFDRSLISAGTLAKHIIKLHPELNLNEESLRTAVRRLKRNFVQGNILKNAQRVLAHAYLHVRNNMVKIELRKEDSTLHLINQSFKINEINNNDIFRLIKGHSVLHAIVEDSNLPKMKEVFAYKILEIKENLCEFIILFPEEGKETPGIILNLVNEMSMNNINLVQAFNCGTEVNLIVDEKDNQRAFNVLTNFFKRCKINEAAG
jgi:aspartokinase